MPFLLRTLSFVITVRANVHSYILQRTIKRLSLITIYFFISFHNRSQHLCDLIQQQNQLQNQEQFSAYGISACFS